MKSIYRSLCFIGLLLCLASFTSAADVKWTGQVTDSFCAASPAQMTASHKMTEHECALDCVKKGAQYVFVYKGKIYNIANQDFADLQVNAGYTVQLTGTLNDKTITVTKIAMPAKKDS